MTKISPSYTDLSMNLLETVVPDSGTIGSGDRLPKSILAIATLASIFATILSISTIIAQLKNYRKPQLQRFTVRILVMVPIFSIASVLSLYSLDAAFFIDLARDFYEAFVIYCFFNLLVEYLGGERNLLILLSGRHPISHLFPINLIYPPLDPSDPFTFLGLKRCILQYVQIKPILALVTAFLKATGTYKDGSLQASSGYSYVSAVQNISVSLSLYSLLLFWKATSTDLQPFNPAPKFASVKGILFFSFWQGFAVSILVAAGIIHSSRFDQELLSLAIQDTLISLEMPAFALLHQYAFSFSDYIDSNHVFVGRMSFYYACRDAFGFKDIVSDTRASITGKGFSYRSFEPVEGNIHVGLARERRVRAGLRYSAGGKTKYWLPMPGEEAHSRKGRDALLARPVQTFKTFMEKKNQEREGYAAFNEDEANDVVHSDDGQTDPKGEEYAEEYRLWKARQNDGNDTESDVDSLEFEEDDENVEKQYLDARRLEFGDFNSPVIDCSKEEIRRRLRDEEDGMVARIQGKGKGRAVDQVRGYGALGERQSLTPPNHPAREGSNFIQGVKDAVFAISGRESDEEEDKVEQRVMRNDAVDLIFKDENAEEQETERKRRKGEPGPKTRVYRLHDTSGLNTPSGTIQLPNRLNAEIQSVTESEAKVLVTESLEFAPIEVDPPTHALNGSDHSNHNPWAS